VTRTATRRRTRGGQSRGRRPFGDGDTTDELLDLAPEVSSIRIPARRRSSRCAREGRGGTDLTAVALAAALGAETCEICSDVEGVFTADPRIAPNAQKLRALSYDEMLELAASGARVLQLRSVEFARNHNVRLHVRSTFADADGTWITQEEDPMLEKAIISGVVHMREELVYRATGIGAADLFDALAHASGRSASWEPE
jgi:aspartate kinase